VTVGVACIREVSSSNLARSSGSWQILCGILRPSR